jgi:hypothetical protein
MFKSAGKVLLFEATYAFFVMVSWKEYKQSPHEIDFSERE